MADDGVTPILITSLNPPAGGRAKVTIDPPVRINELTQIFLNVGGIVPSQQKRTDEGIWIMEFRVDRDVDPTRGTADVYIA
jgi:hypothetical protein